MSTFPVAVQEFVEAVRRSVDYEEVTGKFHKALELMGELPGEVAQWTVLSLVELLASRDVRYQALIAVLIERSMALGGDAYPATGWIIERFVEALHCGPEFERACLERFQAVSPDAPLDPEAGLELQHEIAREMPTEVIAWAELDIWCQVSAGLLHSFAEARSLFRHLGGTIGQLDALANRREGPRHLADLLRTFTNEPAIPGFPEGAFRQTLLRLDDALGKSEPIISIIPDLFRSLFGVDHTTRNLALRELGERIRRVPVPYVGDLTQVCGTLVEIGGDPNAALDGILSRLPEVLRKSARFQNAALELAEQQGVDLDEMDLLEAVERFGTELADTMPGAAQAWHATPPLCLGAVAHLSRNPDGRKSISQRAELINWASTLAGTVDQAMFLVKMLRVLDDEEILVLVPDHALGYRVRIGGIGDNFQLHTLLAGTIIGPAEVSLYPGVVGTGSEDQIPGRPLPPRVIGTARDLPCTARETVVWSLLQLWTYKALDRDANLPGITTDSGEHFVYNEGVPADIPAFEGTRILLVGSAPFTRSWNGGRLFPGMAGRCELVARLETTEVKQVLRRIAGRV